MIDVKVTGLAAYGVFYATKRKPWAVAGLCAIVVVWQVLAFHSNLVVAGTASSSLVAGIAAYERGDFVTAEKVLRRHADVGNPTARLYLGVMYATGKGVAQDFVEAVKWYRKAAEQGFAQAQYNLGWMYVQARGVPEDHVEAVKWFRKAAEQGYPKPSIISV